MNEDISAMQQGYRDREWVKEKFREQQKEVDDKYAGDLLLHTLEKVKQCKPNDRSEKDRRYAVTITMLEQAYAYFNTYIMQDV